MAFNASYYATGDITGTPTFAGNYGIAGLLTNFNTYMNTTRQTHVHVTMAPFTTGVAIAKGGNFGTNLSLSGSHMLNVTNLTGTISLVRPFVTQRFWRDQTGVFQGNAFTSAQIERVTMTFLPEPRTQWLAAVGAIGLAALAALGASRRA